MPQHVFVIQTQIGAILNIWYSEELARKFLEDTEKEGYVGLICLKIPIADNLSAKDFLCIGCQEATTAMVGSCCFSCLDLA